MKRKLDFITNSSSTSYTIFNKTNNKLTARQFVNEIWDLIKPKMESYDMNYTKEDLIKSLEKDYNYFPMKQQSISICVFGDHDCTIAGEVFDYVLRDEINLKKLLIKYRESLR